MVIDGGCTRSIAAISPALSGPHLPTVASADSWDSVAAVFTRWDRSRRAARSSDSRSAEASSARATGVAAHIVSLANNHQPCHQHRGRRPEPGGAPASQLMPNSVFSGSIAK